jgi:hypothetical protein
VSRSPSQARTVQADAPLYMSDHAECRPRAFPCDPSQGVIVGTAIGYGFRQVKSFLTSLRETGFRGSVLLALARGLPASDLAQLERMGVTPYFVRPAPWIASSRRSVARGMRGALRASLAHTPLSTRLALTLQGPISRRWGLYSGMVAMFPDVFEHAPFVFLSDVRDVRFQSNPSRVMARLCDSSPLHLFAEGDPGADASDPSSSNGALLIRDQADNQSWIEYLGGRSAAERLQDRQVVCAGTVVLTSSTLLKLSQRMVRAVAVNRLKTAPLGLDQGALNYLFYTGALDDLDPVVHPNVDGGVLTIGMCSPSSWSFEAGSVMVNGEKPPVVHQYDRVPALNAEWHQND